MILFLNKKDLFETVLYEGYSLKSFFMINGKNKNGNHLSWSGCEVASGIYNGPEFDSINDFANDPNKYQNTLHTFINKNIRKPNESNNTKDCGDIIVACEFGATSFHGLQQELRNVLNNRLGLEQRWFEYCKIKSISFIKQIFIDVAAVYGRTLGKDLFIYVLNATNQEQKQAVLDSCMNHVINT